MIGDEWTTVSELDALAEWGRNSSLMAEIGTWTGRSAEALLRYSHGRLYCVDHFRPGQDRLPTLDTWVGRTSVIDAWHKRVGGRANLLEMESGKAAEFVKANLPSLDLVFIDGTHDEFSVARDIMLWKPLLRPGGLLCGHDYNEDGVRRAVNAAFPSKVTTGPEKLWSAYVT